MGDIADDLRDIADDNIWSQPLPRHTAAAPGVWMDQKGVPHVIDELERDHLRNILNWLGRISRAFGVREAAIAGRVRLGRLRAEARRRGLLNVQGRWV